MKFIKKHIKLFILSIMALLGVGGSITFANSNKVIASSINWNWQYITPYFVSNNSKFNNVSIALYDSNGDVFYNDVINLKLYYDFYYNSFYIDKYDLYSSLHSNNSEFSLIDDKIYYPATYNPISFYILDYIVFHFSFDSFISLNYVFPGNNYYFSLKSYSDFSFVSVNDSSYKTDYLFDFSDSGYDYFIYKDSIFYNSFSSGRCKLNFRYFDDVEIFYLASSDYEYYFDSYFNNLLSDIYLSNLNPLSQEYFTNNWVDETSFNDLSDDYQQLLLDNADLQDRLSDLLTDYNVLQSSYESLNSSYNSLLSEFQNLQSQFEQLESNYNDLLPRYNQLLTNYNNLLVDYNQLESNYNTLNSSYQNLQILYDDLNNDFSKFNVSSLYYMFNGSTAKYFNNTSYDYLHLVNDTPLLSEVINFGSDYSFISSNAIPDITDLIINNGYDSGNRLLDRSIVFLPLNNTYFVDSLTFSRIDKNQIRNIYLYFDDDTMTNIFIEDSGDYNTKSINWFNTDNKYLVAIAFDVEPLFDIVSSITINSSSQIYQTGYDIGYADAESLFGSDYYSKLNQIEDLRIQLSQANATIQRLQDQINSDSLDLSKTFWTMADIPFLTVSKFLGFEILGVNFFGVFVGLLTLAAIFWLIRKFKK